MPASTKSRSMIRMRKGWLIASLVVVLLFVGGFSALSYYFGTLAASGATAFTAGTQQQQVTQTSNNVPPSFPPVLLQPSSSTHGLSTLGSVPSIPIDTGIFAVGLYPGRPCDDCVTRELYAVDGNGRFPMGEVRTCNDQSRLWLQFRANPFYCIKEVHIDVRSSCEDIPETGGNDYAFKTTFGRGCAPPEFYFVGNFKTTLVNVDNDSTRFCIAVDQVGLNTETSIGILGQTLGQCDPFGMDASVVCEYIPGSCNVIGSQVYISPLRTETQSNWGGGSGSANVLQCGPATEAVCYLEEHFVPCFADSGNAITLGCLEGKMLSFTTASAIKHFLPRGGSASVLEQSDVDPVEDGSVEGLGGILAGQLLAASLNVKFDLCDAAFGSSESTFLQDLCIVGAAPAYAYCNGRRVSDLLADANTALGGCECARPHGCLLDVNMLSNCLALVNQNYADGSEDLGHLSPVC